MKFIFVHFFLASCYLDFNFSHGFRLHIPGVGGQKEGITTEAPKPTPIPLIARVKEMSQFSKDMMHHDYVGVGIDGTAILETFKLKWPVKIAVKLTNKLLSVAHPVYLKIFPGAKGKNETLLDSIFSMAQNGPKMMGGALKMINFMNEIKSG